MASEQVPSSDLAPTPPPPPPTSPPSQLQPLQEWFARLGLSGKLLAFGGLVGVIAVFLPLVTMSFQMQTPVNTNLFKGKTVVNLPEVSTSQSTMVVQDWRGTLCLVGYLATLVLAFVLYPPNGLGNKNLAWAGVGLGGLIALLALLLLVFALNFTSGMTGFGSSLKCSIGIGTILNLLAGAAVAGGGFLKAREEKLF